MWVYVGMADLQQGSAQARADRAVLQSLPEAVAVPAQHEHPQSTAPSDLTGKICPYLSNVAASARKTLMEDSTDLHGILQVYTTCHYNPSQEVSVR